MTVNSLADDPDRPVAGQTTLRDAINAADAGSTANKYVIKFAVHGTIALQAPLPELTGNGIQIKGFIHNAGLLQIEHPMTKYASTLTVAYGSNNDEISGVTFFESNQTSDFGGAGAIENNGGLTLDHVYFINNECAEGGTVFTSSLGITKIKDCVFIGNSASVQGGAVYNDYDSSRATIINCTFINNTAPVGADIFNAGTLTISKKLVKELGDGLYNVGTIIDA